MAWVVIVVAGLFETGFAVFLKMSDGLTRVWPDIGFAVCALVSFGLLTLALRELEVGAAYAVWTGIGAAGAATVGMIFLGDPASALKLASIALILAGVVGLNLSGVTPLRLAKVLRVRMRTPHQAVRACTPLGFGCSQRSVCGASSPPLLREQSC